MAKAETLPAAHQLYHLQPKIEGLWNRKPADLTPGQVAELSQYPNRLFKAVHEAEYPNRLLKSGSWSIPETHGSSVSVQPITERTPAPGIGFQNREIGQTEQLYHSWKSPEGTPWSVTISRISHPGGLPSQAIIDIAKEGQVRRIVQACA